jgi:hypothetical protein
MLAHLASTESITADRQPNGIKEERIPRGEPVCRARYGKLPG